MSAEAIDLDHPGYMRHCDFLLCPAQFHVLRGPVAGWIMGRSGAIGASYFCPEHAPLVREHIPRWLRLRQPPVGTLCACGWKWMPATQCPLGDHLLAWLLHLRPDAQMQPGQVAPGHPDAAKPVGWGEHPRDCDCGDCP